MSDAKHCTGAEMTGTTEAAEGGVLDALLQWLFGADDEAVADPPPWTRPCCEYVDAATDDDSAGAEA